MDGERVKGIHAVGMPLWYDDNDDLNQELNSQPLGIWYILTTAFIHSAIVS